jgi:hypothetical protein
MPRAKYKHISMDLHAEAALRAVSLLGRGDRPVAPTRGEDLCETLAGELSDHPAPARRQIAHAVVRRLFGRVRGSIQARPVHRLLLRLGEASRRHLLLYLAAEREPLLGALAHEVLYPYLVLEQPPAGVTVGEFQAANTGQLFAEDRVITHAFVEQYAARRWRIRRPATTRTALRMFRDGALLEATWVEGPKRARLGYFESAYGIAWPVFAYALYQELEREPQGQGWAADRLLNSDFVNLFLIPRVRVQALLTECRERALVQKDPRTSGYLDLCLPDTAAAVEWILTQEVDVDRA